MGSLVQAHPEALFWWGSPLQPSLPRGPLPFLQKPRVLHSGLFFISWMGVVAGKRMWPAKFRCQRCPKCQSLFAVCRFFCIFAEQTEENLQFISDLSHTDVQFIYRQTIGSDRPSSMCCPLVVQLLSSCCSVINCTTNEEQQRNNRTTIGGEYDGR